MKTLTEREIQDEYVDFVFALGNRDQEYWRRVERGIAYKSWLRDRDRLPVVRRVEGGERA